MNDTNGNPYISEKLESFATGTQAEAQAITAAVLALTYEQRTGNLIAAYETMIPKREGDPVSRDQLPVIYDVRDQINARLGLNQEATK